MFMRTDVYALSSRQSLSFPSICTWGPLIRDSQYPNFVWGILGYTAHIAFWPQTCLKEVLYWEIMSEDLSNFLFWSTQSHGHDSQSPLLAPFADCGLPRSLTAAVLCGGPGFELWGFNQSSSLARACFCPLNQVISKWGLVTAPKTHNNFWQSLTLFKTGHHWTPAINIHGGTMPGLCRNTAVKSMALWWYQMNVFLRHRLRVRNEKTSGKLLIYILRKNR